MTQSGNHKSTLNRLLVIAVPMVISQASDTVMLFFDRLFLSRLGGEFLAASMSGGLSQFMVSSFFFGTIGYVTAVVAQYYGAEKYERCAVATFQAVVLSILSYPIILAASPLIKTLFTALGQTPLQVELAYTYYHTLIFGVVVLLLRYAMAGFFIGIGRTRVVMIANAAGMIINLPANYVLIYGKFGFPELGLRGAAVGTILGNLVILIILAVFYFRLTNRVEYKTHKAFNFDGEIFRTLVKFGVPAGIEMFLNVAAFNLFVQMMHTYGTNVAAAVTISFNWDIVAFLPMLGMGHAVTSLAGQCVGAGDLTEARKVTVTGLKTAWVYSGTMVLVFLLFARPLTSLFLPAGPEAAEIGRLAEILLRLASIYILADSAQIVFVGALRGAGDTHWVMAASVVMHWCMAGIAFYLIRILKADPVGAWIGFIGFIVLLGVVMYFRFRGGKWEKIDMIGGKADHIDCRHSSGINPEIGCEELIDESQL
ncbi:MAG: MATE family efflux transporter [Spirochaetales bacterium]|uniref:Multidrug-efflux transporter n=1 Tax=Candidatus Thalassospirochaeta sargassi TaxID=3119039 RepID=A0AAJ1MNP9_9SPIO|nr:MATE family efflux transporter [Spirochaetales bacterium]